MGIQRSAHPVFAVLWLAWSVGLVYVTFFPSWLAYGILGSCGALIEGVAVRLNTGKRDTMSELATLAHRKLAKGPLRRVPYRGWNALLFAPYISLIGFNVARLFGGHGVVVQAFGVYLACLISVGLWDHWVSPDVNG